MTAKYLTKDRRITFEVTGETMTYLFRELAAVQEVFDAEHKCGVCGGTELRLRHRIATKGSKKYDYYHLVCITRDERTGFMCGARFDFGQSQELEGTLFPKRKDKDGKWLPNGGWSRYTATEQQSGSSQQQNDSDPWQ